MIDKIRRIKYSRLSPYDKLLTDIFSNLTEINTEDAIYYCYNDVIILRYSLRYKCILYGIRTIYKPLVRMGLDMRKIDVLIQQYIKDYLDFENTLPWRADEDKWIYIKEQNK